MILLPLIYGILSSWHGGQITIPYDVKAVKNIAWCVPALIVAIVYLPLWTVIFIPLCALKGIGHGRIWNPRVPLDLSKEPEAVERWGMVQLYGRMPDFWYKVLCMSATGLAAASGAVMAFLFVDPLAALFVAIGGAFKGINAIIFTGHKEDGEMYNETEAREVADGVAFGTGLLAAIIVL